MNLNKLIFKKMQMAETRVFGVETQNFLPESYILRRTQIKMI